MLHYVLTSYKSTLLALGMTLLILSPAHAQDALSMKLVANAVTTNADGKLVYTPVKNAKAGQLIQYKATYTNNINKAITDLAVTLPVPINTAFTGTAQPVGAMATIDGKTFAAMPLMRNVNGKLVKVPLSEYRALRWNIKLLPAKQSADVSLNATVNK